MTRFVSAQTDADTDLKKFRQTEYAQKPAHKTFNRKFRLATVSCMVAVVIILAIVLPITLNPKQTIPDSGDSLYFLTNEQVEYADEESIESFNAKNNSSVIDIKSDYLYLAVKSIVEKSNKTNIIGIYLSYFVNSNGIKSLSGNAYVSNFRIGEMQNENRMEIINIKGIEYKYYFNVVNNSYEYTFTLHDVEYQMEAVCEDGLGFEEMINILY